MNDIAKQSASDKLQSAIAKEEVTTNEAGDLIGIKPNYISMFKNPKLWKNVGNPQWEKLLQWVNSGYSLKEYPKHRKVDPPDDMVKMNKLKINTVKDIILDSKLHSGIKFYTPKPSDNDEALDKKTPRKSNYRSRIDLEDMDLICADEVVRGFIKNLASCIVSSDCDGDYPDTRYYYIPFWFKETEGEKGLKLISFNKLPTELIDAIKAIRGE